MIIRGTTPIKKFGLPFASDLVEIGFVTVSQNGTTVIDKPLTACTCEGNVIAAHFTQEETLRLSDKSMAEMRIVVKTKHGERFESNAFSESVGATSKNEVI